MTDIVGQAARVLFIEISPISTHDAEDAAQALADAGLLREPVTSILEEFVTPCPKCTPDEGRCAPCRGEADAYYQAAINAINPNLTAKELARDGDSDSGGYVGRDLRELAARIKRHLLQHPEPARTMPTRDEIAEAVETATQTWDEPLDEIHDIPPITNAVLELLAGQPTATEAKAQAWEEGAQAAWSRTGDGWNGEYAEGTHDGSRSFRDCNPDTTNPYRTQDRK